MKREEFVSNSIEETQEIAEAVVQKLSGGTCIALYGDLGCGKTTFTQGIGKALGIEKPLKSPTFIIMRKYEVRSKKYENRFPYLFHVDLYRTETEHEIEELGIREIINDPKSLVVIEWAEKMGSLLPEKRIDIHFEYLDEKKRKITIEDRR